MRLVVWVASAIFLIDQALKYWVVHVLNLDRIREYDLLPPWLNLRMAWNQGVNFGLFASSQSTMRWVLVGVAVAICLWVWIWVWRARLGRLAQVSAGLLIGGALGNVIDRIAYGAVADFLNMSLPGWQNPYSFNVADIAIFAGAIGLVLLPQKPAQDAPKPKPKPARPAKAAIKAPAKPAAKPAPMTAVDDFRPEPRQGDLFRSAAKKPAKPTRDGSGKSR
ncbi:signal peptidase II [Paracoccus sp. C2R09]|nr:signal peptidase II [Paracoccus sp. C2R09]